MAGQAVGGLLQTCNQLEEHFVAIEVAGIAGCRPNLVFANLWSCCHRRKMNLLRLRHKHHRRFCGLERALRLDKFRAVLICFEMSTDVKNCVASERVTLPFFLCKLCSFMFLPRYLFSEWPWILLRAYHKGHSWSVLCELTRYPESVA